jgi:hypothetical protein
MFCSNCGKELGAGVQFCPSCGHAAGVGAPANGAPAAAAPAMARTSGGFLGWLRGLKTWKKVALGIVAFIFAVIALAMFATSGLEEPVKRHFTALHSGDVVGAYADLSIAARQATSLDAFKQMLANNSALTHVTGESFSSRSYQDSQGHLKGMLEIEGGGKFPIEVNLVKENGAWKILSYHATSATGSTIDEGQH